MNDDDDLIIIFIALGCLFFLGVTVPCCICIGNANEKEREAKREAKKAAPFKNMFTDNGIPEKRAVEFATAIIGNDPDIDGPAGLKNIFNIYGEENFRRDVIKGTFNIYEATKHIQFVSALKRYHEEEEEGGDDGDEFIVDPVDPEGGPTIIKKPLKKKKKKESFHAFLTHNWGNDEEGRNNHKRVVQFKKALSEFGIENLWLDEERMTGNIVQQMCDGIDNSKLVVVFITQAYIDKVAGRSPKGYSDNCLLEYQYAAGRKGSTKLIAVVMEDSCSDSSKWDGPIGMHLGTELYYAFKKDSDLRRCAKEVATEIRSRLGDEFEFDTVQSKSAKVGLQKFISTKW